MAIEDSIKVLVETFGDDRCRVITDQGDYSHIIRVKFPNNDDIQVQLAIPSSTTIDSKPDVFVRGGQPEVRAGLERRVQEFKIEHPVDSSDNSILSLFQFCETLLVEHNNSNDSAAAATCKDVSPKKKTGSKKQRVNSSPIEEVGQEKKAGMKTAYDVIKRLRWDKSLPAERFSVGYLDRFLGVLEKPFDAFNWEDDLVDAPLTDLAIPQHRIQYFKYRVKKVWDKNERLDLIFNSVAADSPTIYRVMDEENEKSGERAVAPSDDFESENEITSVAVAATLDTLEEDVADAVCNIDDSGDVPKGIRPDYFLSIPIDDPIIRSRVSMVQDSFKSQFPRAIKTLIATDHLHITVALFCSRDQPGGLNSVISALNNELEALRPALTSKLVQFRGLTLLADKVLCSCPDEDFKSAIIEPLKSVFGKYGLQFYTSSVPHLTIGKLNLAKDLENAEAVKNSVSVSRFNGSQELVKLLLRPVGIKSDKEWTFVLNDN